MVNNITLDEIRESIYSRLRIYHGKEINNRVDKTKWMIYDFDVEVSNRNFYYGDEDECGEELTTIKIYRLLEKFTLKTNKRQTKKEEIFIV